jgi:uncharacterized protein (DUF1501 family)
MKRRNFIKSISATAGASAIMLNGTPLKAMENSPLINLLKSAGSNCEDHVLVMVQLNGGNDGLNTIVPLDQLSNLVKVRNNITIPENKLLSMNGVANNALHPALTGFQTLFNDSKATIVQNVGYPNQDYSHFRSTDIWLTASNADTVLNTGWGGRYFNTDHPLFPEGYPNTENPDPIAIQVGYIASPAFHGPNANFGHTINGLDEFYDLVEDNDSTDTSNPYGHELAFIRRTARQTNAYNERIKSAAESAANISTLYPAEGENELADQLKIVSRCVAGGLKTKMYLVTLGGFDTHALQVDSNDVTQGTHADLLKKIGDALIAFQDDIEKLNVSERVLSMTFSEFGRRITSNGSLGTDHGAAAPVFMVSNGIDAGIIGENPTITGNETSQDNLPMQIDFRSVYGSVLRDWFCVDEETIREVLFGDFPKLRLTATSIAEKEAGVDAIVLYPNPVGSRLNVKLALSTAQKLNFEVYNALGMRVKQFDTKQVSRGEQVLEFEMNGIKSGAYHLRVYGNNVSLSKPFLKK